jgi:integrase/recombinase XerD
MFMLAAYVQRFLTSRTAEGAAVRTVDWYRYNLEVYLAWLSDQPRLRWDDVETLELYMVAQREAGLKPNSVHGRYRALSAWFSWLVKRKIIKSSPIAEMEAPKVDQEPVEYMRLAEYERLMKSIDGPGWMDKRDRCMIYLLFWCGLRVSEAVALKLADVDLPAKLVTVRLGKGGKGRLVPCGADLGTHLLAYLMARPVFETERLFVGSDGAGGVRGHFTPAGVRQMMKRRCEAAGMRYISPHKGRHGLAMALLNEGMDMSAVSNILGHSNQKTTADRYAKWLTDGLSRQYAEVRGRLLTNGNK